MAIYFACGNLLRTTGNRTRRVADHLLPLCSPSVRQRDRVQNNESDQRRQRNRPSPSRVNDSFWFLIAVVLDAHKWSRAAVKPSGAAQLWSAHASTPLRVQLPGPNQPACMPPCQHCLPVSEKTCSRSDSRWASIGRLGVPLDASPPTTSTCRCPLRFTCPPPLQASSPLHARRPTAEARPDLFRRALHLCGHVSTCDLAPWEQCSPSRRR
jgi:hypothetical protein